MSDFEGFAIVPPEKGDGFRELSSNEMLHLARQPQGRVFRKQILHYGDLIYPGVKGGRVKVDEEFADKLITNFTNKVADIVQIPKAGPDNEHTEDPDRNIGEVINLVKTPKGVYADLDVRIPEDAEKIGKTLLGASAMLHLNYEHTKTGEKVGPTLLHTAITNRPYVTELDDFEEIVAASGKGADSTYQMVVLTPAPETQEESKMTLDELLAELKTDHDIDVPALQAKAAEADKALALSNKIQEELVTTGLLKLSNTDETVDADTLIGAVAEAGEKIVELTNSVKEIREEAASKEATAEVEKLVLSGYILPKNKTAMVQLRKDNKELFDQLVPEKPIVKLSQEEGQEPTDESHQETVESEIARLTAIAGEKTSAFVRA